MDLGEEFIETNKKYDYFTHFPKPYVPSCKNNHTLDDYANKIDRKKKKVQLKTQEISMEIMLKKPKIEEPKTYEQD